MNKRIPKLSVPLLLLALLLMSSAACDRTRNDKGYEYFPDMSHSLAYETYAPAPVLPQGQLLQAPPAGTLARGALPLYYPATDQGRVNAGKSLSNPLESTAETLNQGQKQYTIFCQSCHGKAGDGMGFLYSSKKYAVAPASLIGPTLDTIPDGALFHSISWGYGVMGAHAAQISINNRWRIIHYIREKLNHQTTAKD